MVGIDISDRSIKIAEVSGGDTPRIRTVCWSPLPGAFIRRGVIQNVSEVAGAVRGALQKCSPLPVDGDTVVASIPETQSFVRVLELPDMPDRDVHEAVMWAVRQHIPFDLERMYIDWESVSMSQAQRRQVLVGAVQREVVDPLLEVLDAAGLRVVALELEAQAIVRALLPQDSQAIQGVLIIDLGATSTNIVFFDQGRMQFTSSVQLGGDDLTKKLATELHLQPSQAAEQKAIVGLQQNGGGDDTSKVALALQEATMTLLQQVKKVVRELAAQQQEEHFVRAILLSGGSANLPGLTDVVAQVFPNIPIQLGNPWTNISFRDGEEPPLSLQDANHFVTSVGLALREEERLL